MSTVTNKSVLLIGNIEAKSVLRLINEAKEFGLIFDVVTPDSIIAHSNEFVSGWGVEGRDIWSYDVYFFRAVSRNLISLAPFLSELAKRGKRVVENCLVENGVFPEDKFVAPSKNNNYKIPESIAINSHKLSEYLNKITFPVVVKKVGIGSSLGKGVKLVKSENELISFCDLFPGIVQIQKYYEISYDTRVFVIGGKCICGYDRYKTKDNFLTTAKGGERKATNLSVKQCEAAVEATMLQGLEISGVDMFISDEDIYIIEVNSSPRFKILEKVTEVNVAKEVLEYLVS